jgi:putative transposase
MNRSGQFFISILVETEQYNKLKTGKTIGIDLGIKTLVTLSDNTIIDNPHYLRESQAKLKKT